MRAPSVGSSVLVLAGLLQTSSALLQQESRASTFTTASATPSAVSLSSFTCPDNNNVVLQSSKKLTYRLGCDTDFTGSDLGWSDGKSLLACIAKCEAVQGCAATVYASFGACYFKGANSVYRRAQGAQGAILYSLTNGQLLGAAPSSSTSASRAPSSSPVTGSATQPSASSGSPATSAPSSLVPACSCPSPSVITVTVTATATISIPAPPTSSASGLTTPFSSPASSTSPGTATGTTTPSSGAKLVSAGSTDTPSDSQVSTLISSGQPIAPSTLPLTTASSAQSALSSALAVVSTMSPSSILSTVPSQLAPSSVFPTSIASAIAPAAGSLVSTTSSQALSTASATPVSRTLNVLPLGDSITKGVPTTNGYRLALVNYLMGSWPLWSTDQSQATSGTYQKINMLGSQNDGNFTQNAHEGWPGMIITDIQSKFLSAAPSYPKSPDVVLLDAGTNDVIYSTGNATLAAAMISAPARLSGLMDSIFTRFPRTTILVAAVGPMALSNLQAASVSYDTGLVSMVLSRATQGQRVMTVDMSTALTSGLDMSDWVHPSSGGYEKMANVWYQGILSARAKGWIA